MKTNLKNKTSFLIIPILFLALLYASCSNDDDAQLELLAPTIENIEIGSSNNGIGVIGRDFHFDMDVIAGGFIENVQVKIQPRSGETYAQDWSYEITWDEYQGMKNTNVHKHFDVPEDAVEGIYDLLIIVSDQNGTTLEEIHTIELVDPSNLPVDPYLYLMDFYTDNMYQYVNELLQNPEDIAYSEGDVFKSSATIKKVKGDGKMYLLFIKKSANHLPTLVDDIDFSKVIVYDVFEHENEEDVYSFSNVLYDGQGGFIRPAPEFSIGASHDNNMPEPNPITGEKEWESGEYYLGVVYTNTKYNLSVYHYVEVDIIMN
tara:strand:- start:1328 stop:2278 length:951 start_codon:yes stop_codon:yes gene_type:complete